MKLKRCLCRATTPHENIAIWAAVTILFLSVL